jgi:hypothetical protein
LFRPLPHSIFALLLLPLAAAGVIASSSAPVAGLTGAPGENLCSDCHAGVPPNTGPGALTIDAPASYLPGEEYLLQVRLGQAGKSRWGFQLTVLTAGNAAAGTLLVADSVRTALQTGQQPARTYVNHRDGGTWAGTGDGPVQWLVRWRAPAAGTGPVTFYLSGNAANNNGDPTGDDIYTAAVTSQEGSALDTLRFLSFPAESLITKRAEKRRPASTLWSAEFRNMTGGEVSRLEIRFNGPVTLNRFVPFPEAWTVDGGETWVVSGQTILPNDVLRVEGSGPRTGTEVRGWRFGDGQEQPGFTPAGQFFVPPLPNSANVRAETFEYGGFARNATGSDAVGGLVVGRSFLLYRNFRWRVNLDSARVYGWVRIRSQSALRRTLVYGRAGRLHAGEPRGFCAFDNGRPFVQQVYSLPPVRMDNRLVAEAAALKMNIAASQLGITPHGFGELVYNDPGHPFHGMLVRRISAVTDSFLTRCRTTPHASYDMADSVLRKINRAFVGSIDTVSFSALLVLKGARSVAEVPFLAPADDVEPIRIDRVYHPEFADGEEAEEEPEEEPAAAPEVVQLVQSYPNPFNPATTIRFELHEASFVTLAVYDMLGREVARLVQDDLLVEGTNEAEFLADGLASGVYFYRLTAEAVEDPARVSRTIGKMVLVR